MLFGIGNGLLLTGLEAWVVSSEGSIFIEPVYFLLRMVLVTALFFVLFLFRMIGAGDIKMAALICGYMGLHTGALAIFSGFLIGAIWSLIKMIGNGILICRFSYLLTYIRYVFQTGKITAYYRPERDGYDFVIPFGFCLFLGTLISLAVFQ
jgi:prepilin peptidase CpaA